MTEDRFETLLGPYTLGELNTAETGELELHLKKCPECRSELERVRRTHGLLREAAAGGPPPELKARVLERAISGTSGRNGGRWKLWLPVAAALLVVAVLSAEVVREVIGGPSTGVTLTATSLAPGASGEVRGERAGENIRVELEVWNLPELPEDEYYEMWYANEDGERISGGAFRTEPDEERTTVTFTAPINARNYPEIEVTRETDDGNPESSGDKVLEGNLQST